MDKVAQLDPRNNALDIVNNLKQSVAKPFEQLRNPDVSYDEASSALSEIRNAIGAASAAYPSTGVKHDLSQITSQLGLPLEKQGKEGEQNDLDKVGHALADVIKDVVEAVFNLKGDLKKLPLIGSLIVEIDTGLNTLLVGLQLVLTGVVQVLQGLLKGVSGLLQ
ncbi:hypothetical protein I317_02968 [Kwoniella heveanensis CBS 569]|nr:hypothetical protein I317_02968 [Kwoniella heveanensis CBS 569]